MPISRCRICKNLGEIETSFVKYGHEREDIFLPGAANELQPIGDISSSEARNDHIKVCPSCGTYYHYRWSYEYLANGSEDEETLIRLTPTEAKEHMTRARYNLLIKNLKSDLEKRNPQTRGYAAKSLISHFLWEDKSKQAAEILDSRSQPVREAGFRYLVRLMERPEWVPKLVTLENAFQNAREDKSDSVRWYAKRLLDFCAKNADTPAAKTRAKAKKKS